MDRIEPTHGPDLQGLTFRRSARWSEPPTDARFSIGVAIFLAVALVYPWYSYWVQTRLLARDLRAGVEQLSDSIDQQVGQMNAQLAKEATESAEDAKRKRIAGVRVTGISDGHPPLAMVELGRSNFLESDDTICRQTSRWLRRSVSGTVIRVQRLEARGSFAAIHELSCP